ncbi:hypothetical protein pdam_00020914, partial [Pocillopora damicornis]
MVVLAQASHETKVVDVRGKPLSRGTGKEMAYANFKTHTFSYLNITTIGSDYVGKGSECGFACINIPSCFSFNLAAFHDINGKSPCAPTSVPVKVDFLEMEKHTSSKITWSKLGGTLSDTTVKDGALRINSVQRSHVGSYMCAAHTGLGIFRIAGSLLVKGSIFNFKYFPTLHSKIEGVSVYYSQVPQFTNKPPPRVVVEQGITVTLCCVATGFPRPQVEWTRHQRSTLLSPFFQEDGCLAVNTAKAHGEEDYICRATNSFGLTETVTTVIATKLIDSSCDLIQHGPSRKTDGMYYLRAKNTQPAFSVYCELTTDGRGWTLIARFSNNDVKNWMADTGHWWYDRQVSTGRTESPFRNTDMISPAFWLVRGSEFKITRSDDPSHTPLLQTT